MNMNQCILCGATIGPLATRLGQERCGNCISRLVVAREKVRRGVTTDFPLTAAHDGYRDSCNQHVFGRWQRDVQRAIVNGYWNPAGDAGNGNDDPDSDGENDGTCGCGGAA